MKNQNKTVNFIKKHPRLISSNKIVDEYQFFDSDLWRKYRYRTIVRKGNSCEGCNSPAHHKKVDVYSLDESQRTKDISAYLKNLLVLCNECRIDRGINLRNYIQTKSSKPIRSASKGGSGFYGSKSWIELRNKAFSIRGSQCACCGETEGQLHADHIKPRSKNPLLELELSNIQVLCWICNLGKSNTDETNWRRCSIIK